MTEGKEYLRIIDKNPVFRRYLRGLTVLRHPFGPKLGTEYSKFDFRPGSDYFTWNFPVPAKVTAKAPVRVLGMVPVRVSGRRQS